MSDIRIVFEDSHILVLDKPSGITVNRSETTREEETVQDFVADKFRINEEGESDFYNRAGIVHRIDKETSGILLVAKNPLAFENLQAQFKNRIVEKTYIALVHGHVRAEEGDISVPVGRLPWNRKRFGVIAGGKTAHTYYKVLRHFKAPFTLLELNPKTGRTHQIRVHLKYFNHPIFADFLYAGRKTSRNDRKILGRVFLHAQKISFVHPKSGEKVSFESKLPIELENAIKVVDN